MKIKERGRFYKFRLLFIQIKHGLFLMTFLSLLKRVGLDLGLYYWMQEGKHSCPKPKMKDEDKIFILDFLTLEDIKGMVKISFINYDELLKRFDNGLKVIGMKHKGQIAALMWIEYNDFKFKKGPLKLKSDEVYLSNMYTYQSFRGKNLAPYLRYHSYELLKKEGNDKIYSITNYTNKSSQKFKRKLNAIPLMLFFEIVLFKKYHKVFKIKDYSK